MIERISCEEVARQLGTSPSKIKYAIKNGTMPIGAVLKSEKSTKERIVIPKARFDAWVTAQDMMTQAQRGS